MKRTLMAMTAVAGLVFGTGQALAAGESDPEKLNAVLTEDAEARFGADVTPERIMKEARRGGLIEERDGKTALTDLGGWFLDNWNER